MPPPLETPALPCPECRMKGVGGGARIGNNRNHCATCNRFNQRVIRLVRTRLQEEYPEHYHRLRLLVEIEQYPDVMEAHMKRYPQSRPGAQASSD